jgi:hypothetical protein
MLRHVVSYKFSDALEVLTVSSQTSVDFYDTTSPNTPEDSQLHTRLRENLKSRALSYVLKFKLRRN